MRIVLGIPVYNGMPFVKRQIENIVNVGYDDVVILDDGSTDGTYTKLLEFVEAYKQIHVFKNNHNSVYENVGNRWEMVVSLCQQYSPDWIMVRAMDECLSCAAFKNGQNLLRRNLAKLDEEGCNMVSFPHADLWRSEWWYRVDDFWGSRIFGQNVESLWKNDGSWSMEKSAGIHKGLHRPWATKDKFVIRGINLSDSKPYPLVVLHYGMSSHELLATKLDYQIYTINRIGIRSVGTGWGGIPHPSIWKNINGYKAAYEKGLRLNKVEQQWFDCLIPNAPMPEIKSLYDVINKYDHNMAIEYNKFMGFK